MKKLIGFATFLSVAVSGVIGGCAESGVVISNASRLTSSDVSRREIRSCSGTSCTPSNLEGRVFAAGAMLGELGSTAYHMTFLADSDDIINDPSGIDRNGTLSFDLSSPTTFSGKISIPSEGNMPSSPIVTRIETMFDYIDATFTVSSGALAGAHTIRTVFRDTTTETDVTGEMQWGDKLYKDGTVFKWCDATDCSNTSRPSSPHQSSSITSAAAQAASSDGNPNYVMYSIDLSTNLTVTYAQISCTDCLWTIDYDLSSAIGFTTDPTTLSTTEDLVDSFNLQFACNYEGCDNDDNAVKASLTIGAAGSAS